MGKIDLLDYSKDKIKAEECIELAVGREKLEYCITTYADDGDTVFMANFRCTRWLWRKHFKLNPILSADSMAEGIDLSHINKLVIIDMSFKTSKYTQRLARQANHNRATEIIVDILVCDKPAIGMEVYKAVALKKENFDKNSYERIR